MDLRPKFLTNLELEKVFQCFHGGTKSLALTGFLRGFQKTDDQNVESLSHSLFHSLIQPQNGLSSGSSSSSHQAISLETLILEDHFIDASKLTYQLFPASLRHLSMENCDVKNFALKKSYFFNIASHTPNLESLNLNGCQWFEDHSLMAISKCPKLTSLRVRNCPEVGTCFPYILLAAKFGFENLKILDLRETAIGDGEISAFKIKPKLKQLYIDGRVHRYMSLLVF